MPTPVQKKRVSPFVIRLAGLVVLAAFALAGAFTDTTLSGNDATRFAVIQAVGEQHVFHIENTEFRSVDVVRKDGHVYSDKPLPLAWGLGMFHRLVPFRFTDHYALLVWLYNALAGFAVNALVFWWMFNAFRRVRHGSLLLKGALALGCVGTTWLLSYSVLLNNHTPAALAVLGTYIMLEKFRRAPSDKLAAGIGAAAGMVAAFDIPLGGLCSLAAACAVWRMKEPKAAVLSAAGSGLVLLACCALNFHAYGTWLPLYVAGDTGTYHPNLNFDLGYWFEALAGYRGFFLYMPFLVLGMIPARQESVPDRAMYGFALAGIAFYCLATDEFGGAAYGFRYLVPLIPVLYFRAGRMVLEHGSARWKAGAGVLLLWGLAASLAGAYAPFCVAFEGHRSPPGHFTRVVRSSFGGNLLCASFEYAPDSALTQMLIRHYGPDNAYRFLYESAFNLKRPDLLRRTVERAKEHHDRTR